MCIRDSINAEYGAENSLMSRGWANPGCTARRLQTLFDRQRHRLRDRVLQRCGSSDQALVDRLDRVLDGQRQDLEHSDDLNMAKLEQMALRDVQGYTTNQVGSMGVRDSAAYSRAPAQVGPGDIFNPEPLKPYEHPPPPISVTPGSSHARESRPEPPQGFGASNRMFERGVPMMPNPNSAGGSGQMEVGSGPRPVMHGRRRSSACSSVASTYPPPAGPRTVRSQVPLDLGYSVAGRPPVAPAGGADKFWNPRARAVDEFAVLAERQAVQMAAREQQQSERELAKRREYYLALQSQQEEKRDRARRQQQAEHAFYQEQVRQQQQWEQEEKAMASKKLKIRQKGAQDIQRDILDKQQFEMRKKQMEMEAELRSVENVQQQLYEERQRAIEHKQEMKHHFDTVIQENAEIEHTKQSQRNKQKQDDILLNIEYGKRLEKEEKNRQAQYAAIYERGNRLGAMQGETYKEIDNVKAAEEAAFMKRLDELERIEKQRETDAASKRHVDRLEYRAALDSQVEHKDVLKHQAQLSVQQEREVMLRAVSYTHLRAHETPEHLVCRLLLEKKKKK
eukprot:TRINITY_DN5923_c0_g1_i19.p1 TRINITY_DN5923_c0_g1~~TRINITY_DN5923_c0_g1_i19.p1  ORF type:complete len:564 (+),score=163.56 TRINITY_DN5923_c0_g1_i19:190-1881(+)